MTGVIRRIVADKGFGFVRPDGSEKSTNDHFFHRSCVLGAGFDALQPGDRVEFEVEESPKGPRATNVSAV